MKTTRLFTLVHFFVLLALSSQAQSWRWAVSGGAGNASMVYSDREYIADMATDRNGNIYTISTIANSGVNVAGQPVPLWPSQWPYYSLEVMINSFTCDGVLRWSKLIGCEMGKDLAYALRTDSADGVYAAMYLERSSSLATTLHVDNDWMISGYSFKGLYLVKYDTAGVYKWIAGPQEDTIGNYTALDSEWRDMETDGQGNVYCYMHLPQGTYGGSYVAAAEGDYILKYDRNGAFIGGTKLEANSDRSYYQVDRLTRDPASGKYYIAGYNDDKIYVGNDSVVNSMYILAFDKDGKYLWKRENTIQSTGYFTGRPLLDKAGNIYLSGGVEPGDIFNGYTIPTGGGSRPIVVKMDSTGKHLWATTGVTNGDYWSGGVCLRNSGELVMAAVAEYMSWPGFPGTVNSTPYKPVLTRFNTHTGKVLGMDTAVATYSAITDGAFSSAIVSGGSNSVYVGGCFGDTLTIGTRILTNSGGQDDFFLARWGYDSCSCDTLPDPSFTATFVDLNTFQFTYTGSKPFNTLLWDFGDGITSTQPSPVYVFPGGKPYNVTVTVTNDCGDITFGRIIQTVGVEEVADRNISIYPNPVVDELTIEGASAGSTALIFDISGRLYRAEKISSERSTINSATLPAGMYLLKLSGPGKTGWLHRFVKQ